MALFQSIVAVKVLFVLGIVNAVLVVLIFFTCRCTPGARLVTWVSGGLMKYRFYRRIYGYHCYLWPALWISVASHIVFAFGAIGSPF